MSSLIEGAVHFAGDVTFGGQCVLPNGVVTAAKIAAGAAIESTKIQQRNRAAWQIGDANTTNTAKTVVVHVCTAAGTLREFKAGNIVPAQLGSSTTVDLRKNGASVLSGTITLNNTHAARQLVEGAINTMSVVAGDVLEVSVAVSGGNPGQGVFGILVIDEHPQ